MMTILVTGGCGFIGSHFVRLLLERTDWRIVNLDKLTYAADTQRLIDVVEGPRYRLVHGDIIDRPLVVSLFREEQPWAVVNFAAESHVDRSILDPSAFLSTNVIGLQVLLEAARSAGVERFVQISTDEVYGDVETKGNSFEQGGLYPSSPYAASKAAADLLCLAYQRTYGAPTLIVRSSNNYGPFQFPEKLVPLVIKNALRQEVLPVYGDGGQRRDWLYVEDNCKAIFEVLLRGRIGAVYSVGSGEEHANLETVRAICGVVADEMRRDVGEFLALIRFVEDRPGHDRRYRMDIRKVQQELGWFPQVSFADGLRETVRWYVRNFDWLERISRSPEYRAYVESVYSRRWRLKG